MSEILNGCEMENFISEEDEEIICCLIGIDLEGW